MANILTSQTLNNGPRNLVMKFTNVSDGTDETAVKKVDATDTAFANQGVVPGIHLTITRIIFDVKSMLLRILWEATTNTDIVDLGGDVADTHKFGDIAGLWNPNAAGATGSILFTTVGAMANSSYSIVLYMRKNVA